MQDLPTSRRFVNLIDSRFGRLIVKAYAGKPASEHRWFCVCDCGNSLEVGGSNLRTGNTSSCGCLRLERCKASNTTHGHSRKTREGYGSWAAMLSRCLNPKATFYAAYGGRGIEVCNRWRHGEGDLSAFECFLADMGPRPSLEHSIERINIDGHYEPQNCHWATDYEQVRNRQRTVHIQLEGQTMVLKDALKHVGMREYRYQQYRGMGLGPQEAFDKAVLAHKHHKLTKQRATYQS